MTKRQLQRRAAVAALGLLAGFSLACVGVAVSGLRDNVARADVGVVLGNAVDAAGRPSPRLRARLDKALELYRAGAFGEVIVSGGVDGRGHNEAEVMAQYLTERGVPSERVHVDGGGIDTYQTARNASRLMARRGWTSAVVVSQYFHLARCRLALGRFGVGRVSWAHADYFEARDVYSTGREVVACLYYAVREYS